MAGPALARDRGGEEHHRGQRGEVGDEPGGALGRQVLGHLEAEGQGERPPQVQRLGEVALDELGDVAPVLGGHVGAVHPDDLGYTQLAARPRPGPRPAPTSTTDRAPVSPSTRGITARAEACDSAWIAAKNASSYGVGSGSIAESQSGSGCLRHHTAVQSTSWISALMPRAARWSATAWRQASMPP